MAAPMTYRVEFPDRTGKVGAKAVVAQAPDSRWWNWCACYADGSGPTGNTALTKRGAMICAIAECRWKAQNYAKSVTYKWVAVKE